MKTLVKEALKKTANDGLAGFGYSQDSQQLAKQMCYNVTSYNISSDGEARLDTALSFDELEAGLKFSVSAKGGYGMFSGNAEAVYERSIQDKCYSLSLNYYQYAAMKMSVQTSAGVQALNERGISFYQNGSNPYFGLICGDYFINTFDQGALLAMGINIRFRSHYEKAQFEGQASGSFGNVFSASTKIQQIATANKIGGSVVIQAFQMGGEPSRLSKILSKDSSGDYYATTCSLQAMDDCRKAANGLLDYAVQDFQAQLSNFSHFTPLGIGFAEYFPIKWLNLSPPPSLVTPQVLEARENLATILNENYYYQQNVYGLLNGYPVPWQINSKVYTNITNINKYTQENIKQIINSADHMRGAAGCFDFPEDCETIEKNILAKLHNTQRSDFDFLQQIKYFMPLGPFLILYKNGDGDSWGWLPSIQDPSQGPMVTSITSFSFTNNSVAITGNYKGCLGSCDGKFIYKNGYSVDGMVYDYIFGWDYNGGHYREGAVRTAKAISPYYFELEESSNKDQVTLVENVMQGLDYFDTVLLV